MNPHSKEKDVVFWIIKQASYLKFESTHPSGPSKKISSDGNEQTAIMPTLIGRLTQDYVQNDTEPHISITRNTQVELLEMETASEVVVKFNDQKVTVPLNVLMLNVVPETAIPQDTASSHKAHNKKFMTMTALTAKKLTESKRAGSQVRDSLGPPPKPKEHSTAFLPPPSFEEAMKQLRGYTTGAGSTPASVGSEDDAPLPPPPLLPPPPEEDGREDDQLPPPPELPPPEFLPPPPAIGETETPPATPIKSLLPPPHLNASPGNPPTKGTKHVNLREAYNGNDNDSDVQDVYSSDEESGAAPLQRSLSDNRHAFKSMTLRPLGKGNELFIPPPSFDDHFLPPPPVRSLTQKQTAILPPPPPVSTALLTPHSGETRKKWSELSESEKQKLDVKREKRKNIIKEITDTERTYMDQLKMFQEYYQAPLNTNSRGLSKADITSLFSNLNFIIEFHKTLLPHLEQASDTWTPDTTISNIFNNAYQKFKLYYHYVNNYENGLSVFCESKEKSKKFRKFIDNLDYSTLVKGLCFESFMILPVQRIPRYLLLLTDLKASTPVNHTDYEGLCKTVKLYDDLAKYLNTAKRKNETSKRVKDLMSTFESDQTITYVANREHKGTFQCTISKEKIMCFVFSDICVVTKQKRGDKYPVKQVLPLVVSTARRCSETELHLIGSGKEGLKLVFATPEQRDEAESLLDGSINEAKSHALQETEGKQRNVFDFEGNKYEQVCEFHKACELRISEYGALEKYAEILRSDSNPANKTLGERIAAQLDTILERTKTLSSQLDERVSKWKQGMSFDDLICDGEWLKLFREQTAEYTKLSGDFTKVLTTDAKVASQIARVKLAAGKSTEETVNAPHIQIKDFFTVIQGLFFNTDEEHSQQYIPILQELRFLTTSV